MLNHEEETTGDVDGFDVHLCFDHRSESHLNKVFFFSQLFV